MKYFILCVFLLAHLTVKAQDLIIMDVNGSKAFDQYQSFISSVTIMNNGIVDISAYSQAQLFLSIDEAKSPFDYYVGGFFVPPLVAGESTTIEHLFNNSLIPPGVYYLILTVDVYSEITETDETNNVLIIPDYTITPADVDLIFTSLNLDLTTVTANSIVKPMYEVQNTGTTDMGGSVHVNFYFSSDAILSLDDSNLGWFASGFLAGPDVFTNGPSYQLAIPSVSPGQYYVIGKVDDNGGYSYYNESDESNNTMVVPINVETSNIDLEITSDPFVYLSNENLNLQLWFNLTNHGTTGVGGYTFDVYLSTDTFLDPGNDWEANVGLITGEQIPGQDNKDIFLNCIIAGPPVGSYYVIVVVNPDHTIEETNYNNNIIVAANYVSIEPPPIPALTITSANLADTYDNADLDLVLSVQFLNSGEAYQMNQTYSIVIKDLSNAIVHSSIKYENIYLTPGASAIKSWTIHLDETLQPGNYTIEINCLYPAECYTNNYSLPLTIEQLVYSLSGIIRGEDGTPITNGKLFLYQKGGDEIVKFIQKVVPITSSNFSFQVDNLQHTLYFVPDPIEFPEYVPTILGKTTTLKESSFITLDQSIEIIFDILKINPLPEGNNVISGYINEENIAEGKALASQSYSVILLNEEDDVVALTQTDEEGFFIFANLPAAFFKIVVAFELDKTIMDKPHNVDITSHNANVEFNITSTGVNVQEEVVFFDQSIVFDEIPELRYGDAPSALVAHSTSGLPVSFLSSDESIVRIENNQMLIVGSGEVTITAVQSGNENYQAAQQVNQTIQILKAQQTITFDDISELRYGDAPSALVAHSTSRLPVSFQSSNDSIAKIENNQIVIAGAGEVTITAVQSGNENYQAAQQVNQTIQILKAHQTIFFEDIPEKKVGDLFNLVASSTSGLELSFSTDNNEVVSIDNNVVSILKPGIVKITASQYGNEDYSPATPVGRILVVNVVLGLDEKVLRPDVYPNPTTGILFMDSKVPAKQIVTSDVSGKIHTVEFNDGRIDLKNLVPGIYILKITDQSGTHLYRIIKQ